MFFQCVQFHPNSNYVATGSTDRTVRLWDVLSGNCVRVMTGHKVSTGRITFFIVLIFKFLFCKFNYIGWDDFINDYFYHSSSSHSYDFRLLFIRSVFPPMENI